MCLLPLIPSQLLIGEILVAGKALHGESELTELHLFYNRAEAGACLFAGQSATFTAR